MWRCIVAGSIRISPYHIFLNSKREGYTLQEYTPTRYVPQLSIHGRVRSRVHSRAECQAETTKEEAPCAGSGGGYRQTPSGQTHVQNFTGCHGWENMEKSTTWGSEHQLWEHKKKKAWEMAMGQGAVSGQQWWWRSRRVLGKRCSLKACGKTQDAGEDEDWGRQHIREESEEPSGRKRMLRVAAPNQSTHRGAL